MKKLIIYLLFLSLTGPLYSQQFYLDSIYDERDPELTSKYYYNENFTLKQVVFETEVHNYEHISENHFLYDIYKIDDKELIEIHETKLENDKLSVYSIYKADHNNVEEIQRDEYTYENGLLVRRVHFDEFSLGGQPSKFQFQFEEEFDYDENSNVIYYLLEDLMFRFRERISIRENGVLQKEYIEAFEMGHITFDTTYFNPEMPSNGWVSYGKSLKGSDINELDEVECDSTFHFVTGSFKRILHKEAENCNTYNRIWYVDTIYSSSTLIPFEYAEQGEMDEDLINKEIFKSVSYEIDSSEINEGRYVILKTINLFDSNNNIYATYLRKAFYNSTPDFGEFTWSIYGDVDKAFVIVPNPVLTGQAFTVELLEEGIDRIDIIDVNGALVSTHQLDDNYLQAIQAPYEPGTYFIVAFKDGEHAETQMLIVSN